MKNNTHDRMTYHKIIAMPKISAHSSRKEWEEACWKKLLDSKEWLDHIATPYERHNIVMRTAVAHRLHVGMSYKKIGDELWLSPQTISTIKKGLREKGYRSYAERGKTERKKRVYSPDPYKNPDIKMGNPRKTKYGIVYL